MRVVIYEESAAKTNLNILSISLITNSDEYID